MSVEQTAVVKVPELPAPVIRRGIDEFTWRSLKNSVFPGAASESILMAVDYCKARQLDILKKPVHIVPMYVKDAKTGDQEWRDVIMPGIAEARTTAARTGQYAGQDEPEFDSEIEYQGIRVPASCKATVYRLVHGIAYAFSHRERFVEAVGKKKDGKINSMWAKRPYGQLAKCAEAGALRKAFPEELGGTYVAEEMEGKDFDSDHNETVRSSQPLAEQIRQPRAVLIAEAETITELDTSQNAPAEAVATQSAEVTEPVTAKVQTEGANQKLALAKSFCLDLMNAGATSDEIESLIEKGGGVKDLAHVEAGDLTKVIAMLEAEQKRRAKKKA